jgi:hypothetical protein
MSTNGAGIFNLGLEGTKENYFLPFLTYKVHFAYLLNTLYCMNEISTYPTKRNQQSLFRDPRMDKKPSDAIVP